MKHKREHGPRFERSHRTLKPTASTDVSIRADQSGMQSKALCQHGATRRLRGRSFVSVLALAFLIPLFVVSPAGAGVGPNSDVVEIARSYSVGSVGGQCKVWAGNVINAALAKWGVSARVGGYGSPGGAYYGAYQNAGGQLVSTNDAQPGDLIQLNNPSYRTSDSYFTGMHTAIIVAVKGNGTFTVRDSNWGFTEQVSEHDWTPSSTASSYGLEVNIWRFGTTAPPDRDHDGTPDQNDQCPDSAGPASTGGCPDRDGDGIADSSDRCPDSAGPASTGGCPDRDGDRVADSSDRCVDRAGLAGNGGCPDYTTGQVTGDFNGDGKDDIAAFYRYGANDTGLNVFYGPGLSSWSQPFRDRVSGNWVDYSKPLVGDFNGDGKDDIAAIYRYGANDTGFNVFKGPGLTTWTQVYRDRVSGNWVDYTKAVSGDFNGDGKDDIAAIYRYGAGDTGLNVFSGPGLSSWSQPFRDRVSGNWADYSKPVSGDFNGDGKDDIAAFYRYGVADTSINLFKGPSLSTWSQPFRDRVSRNWVDTADL